MPSYTNILKVNSLSSLSTSALTAHAVLDSVSGSVPHYVCSTAIPASAFTSSNTLSSTYGVTGISKYTPVTVATYSTITTAVTSVISSFTQINKNVVGLLFNKTLDAVINSTVTRLSAGNGVTFRANTAYNGETWAFLHDDRSTSTFTVTTSSGLSALQVAALPSTTITSPETRRLASLGYI